jgi:5'-3' exonuclease
MMAEVFKYTERVVNMARPRKLLFMAIGASISRRIVHIFSLFSF